MTCSIEIFYVRDNQVCFALTVSHASGPTGFENNFYFLIINSIGVFKKYVFLLRHHTKILDVGLDSTRMNVTWKIKVFTAFFFLPI